MVRQLMDLLSKQPFRGRISLAIVGINPVPGAPSPAYPKLTLPALFSYKKLLRYGATELLLQAFLFPESLWPVVKEIAEFDGCFEAGSSFDKAEHREADRSAEGIGFLYASSRPASIGGRVVGPLAKQGRKDHYEFNMTCLDGHGANCCWLDGLPSLLCCERGTFAAKELKNALEGIGPARVDERRITRKRAARGATQTRAAKAQKTGQPE